MRSPIHQLRCASTPKGITAHTKRDEGGGWEAPIAPLCDVSSVVPRGQRLRGRDGASGPAPGDRGADPMIGTKAPSPSAEAGDRKSTRLNSSHVSISYAVFCLKKKRD